MQGVVVGLVAEVADPEGLGRVRVSFPWLPDGSESTWARVAAPLAGAERGLFFQPEVGDEALVAFELGDFSRPYILGYLWNGSDAPPATDPALRLIHTVAGHRITLDDTEGSEQVVIEDGSGSNRIVLNREGITIESSGTVTIKGTQVEIEASAKLSARGTPIHLNP